MIALCLGSATSLFGDAAKPAKPAKTAKPAQPEPFDYDLYNKDKTVYFVNGEFLYWLPNEGALDYAVSMNQPAWSSIVDTFAIGNYKNAEFDWSPGFRLNVGHFNAEHYWDVFAQYAYIPACGTNTTYAPTAANEYLNGTFIQPDLGITGHSAPLYKARSNIHLQYHLVDVLFSRRFNPNQHFRVNVFGGVTSAFIYQKWKIFYEDINGLQSFLRNRWQFQGLGLRIGFEVRLVPRMGFLFDGHGFDRTSFWMV